MTKSQTGQARIAEPVITLVAGLSENSIIGRDSWMPWKLSSDLKRFKADTMGKPIIMGRKTWEGIGRPLPGRLNIVVTRDKTYTAEGATVAGSLDKALAVARADAERSGASEICVVGGGQIYEQAMPLAGRLRLTRVLAHLEGDTAFPLIDPEIWELIRSENVPMGEKDSHPTRYEVYERRPLSDR
jgi:dihydrofolate reductase